MDTLRREGALAYHRGDPFNRKLPDGWQRGYLEAEAEQQLLAMGEAA